MSRDYVSGVLWIDHDQRAANANLRTALWRVRRACNTVLGTDGSSVSLAPGVVVDVESLIAITRRVEGGGLGAPDQTDVNAIVSAGELLPDWYDDWVAIDRERLRQIRLHALDALCVALTQQGRYAAAVDVGLTAVAAEPLRESAHRAVIEAHLREGNRSEAIRQYKLCRRLLDDLGVQPSLALEGLVGGAAPGPLMPVLA